MDENKELPSWKRTGEDITSLLPSMLAGRWWGTSTALYRRSACDAAGPWRDLINEEDWEYDCRIAISHNELCRVDASLSCERHHSSPRLSQGGTRDPQKLKARSAAHIAIVEHALSQGYDHATPEFSHLLVDCFFLSRQCALAGLNSQAESLVAVCKGHLDKHGRHYQAVRLYHLLSTALGWKTMGKLSVWFDRVRS